MHMVWAMSFSIFCWGHCAFYYRLNMSVIMGLILRAAEKKIKPAKLVISAPYLNTAGAPSPLT